MAYRVIVTKNKIGYKLVCVPLRFKVAKYKLDRFSWLSYDVKLSNSISRAKRKIYDYATNNDFKYFVTLTFSNSFDSYNLDSVRIKVQQLIRDLRKRYNSRFDFILIPEKHKKGNWHLHGLFSSDFENDFVMNSHHYLTWTSFDKFGFSSIELIKNYDACCKYITKYITKEFEKVGKSKHLYFCSKGLKTSDVLCDVVCTNLDIDFDYSCDYCLIKSFNDSNFNYYLDHVENNFINYYNSVTDIDN